MRRRSTWQLMPSVSWWEIRSANAESKHGNRDVGGTGRYIAYTVYSVSIYIHRLKTKIVYQKKLKTTFQKINMIKCIDKPIFNCLQLVSVSWFSNHGSPGSVIVRKLEIRECWTNHQNRPFSPSKVQYQIFFPSTTVWEAPSFARFMQMFFFVGIQFVRFCSNL